MKASDTHFLCRVHNKVIANKLASFTERIMINAGKVYRSTIPLGDA